MLTKTEAERLINDIRQNILDLDRNVRAFIMGRGWEALGYETFAEAWEDRFADLKLSQMWTKAVATRALADEGLSATEIAVMLGGSARVTTNILSELLAGVPVEAVSGQVRSTPTIEVAEDETVVREHVRKKERAEPHIIHVKLTPAERKRFETIAKAEGLTLDGAAEIALRLYFAEKAVRQEVA